MSIAMILVVYSLVAIAFLVPTYLEGEANCAAWDTDRVSGLVYCLFWPVLIAAVVGVLIKEGLAPLPRTDAQAAGSERLGSAK